MTRSRNLIKTKKKKYLKFNKGYIGRKKNCLKMLKQYYIKSLQKKFFDLKKKKIYTSKKKIIYINFFSRIYFGLSYSKLLFIINNNNLKINKILILYILLKNIL